MKISYYAIAEKQNLNIMRYLLREKLMRKNNKNKVTFARILAILNQNAIAQAEAVKRQAEADARWEQRQAEADKRQAEADKRQAEADKQIRELRESQAETSELIKITQQEIRETQQEIRELKLVQAETSEQIKITQQEIQETTKGLNKLEKLFGNAQRNLGQSNEEFACNTIIADVDKGETLWGNQYDHIEKNVERSSGQTQGQFDCIAFNSHCIAIIEVKSKPHIKDIEKFPKMIETFRILYPMYKDYTIYIGIASTNFGNNGVIELCKEKGYGVIKIVGDSIEQIPAQCGF